MLIFLKKSQKIFGYFYKFGGPSLIKLHIRLLSQFSEMNAFYLMGRANLGSKKSWILKLWLLLFHYFKFHFHIMMDYC